VLIYDTFHTPKLRIFSIVPGMAAGGAERWFCTLTRHANTVRYVGMSILNGQAIDLHREIAGMPNTFVHSNDPWIVYEKSVAILRECGGADLLLIWGLGTQANDFIDRCKLPVVQVSHSEPALAEAGIHQSFRQYLEMIRGGKANFLAAVSESASRLFEPHRREQAGGVHVVHNGIEVDRALAGRGRQQMRRLLQLPQEAKVIFYCGRISHEKQPHRLVEAMHLLPNDWHLLINGHGEKEQREKLDGLAQSLSPSVFSTPGKPLGRVSILQPHLYGIGDLIGACDVQVLCSQTEAFPLVAIEAWLGRIRFITPAFATMQELFTAYNAGEPFCQTIPLPVKPRDLADAILDDSDAEQHKATAFKIAMNNFTAARMCAKWEEYFHWCHQRWIYSSQIGEVYNVRPNAANPGIEPAAREN
jgi:glycosyltransferase involved in cell wall biosynthesis